MMSNFGKDLGGKRLRGNLFLVFSTYSEGKRLFLKSHFRRKIYTNQLFEKRFRRRAYRVILMKMRGDKRNKISKILGVTVSRVDQIYFKSIRELYKLYGKTSLEDLYSYTKSEFKYARNVGWLKHCKVTTEIP